MSTVMVNFVHPPGGAAGCPEVRLSLPNRRWAWWEPRGWGDTAPPELPVVVPLLGASVKPRGPLPHGPAALPVVVPDASLFPRLRARAGRWLRVAPLGEADLCVSILHAVTLWSPDSCRNLQVSSRARTALSTSLPDHAPSPAALEYVPRTHPSFHNRTAQVRPRQSPHLTVRNCSRPPRTTQDLSC